MMFTEEMRAEDEKRWHARDIVTELGYCGKYMRDRVNMTNLDIRFYAYIMRKAHDMLKAQQPRVMTLEEVAGYVALERETPIYMEFGYLATHAGQVIGLNPKYMYFDDENGLSWDVCEGPDRWKKDGVALCEYNDIWRCWTSRPDEKVRAETAWQSDT